jgi:asparagine synthase (glutamine-hydrolysing)
VCGLLGYVFRHAAPRPDLAIALRELRHRGPDDNGTFMDEKGDWVCGLAHTRLSIVDQSSAGHQPMASRSDRYVIVFNGEVYNFRDVRADLEQRGFVFSSHTDTEVVLAAFECWGSSCVDRFRGMFAFAIWDTHDRSLFLARDRLGVKPLYVVTSPRGIAFASEVRSLMATGCAERKLSLAGVESYLAFGSVGEPDTILEGVQAFEPGTTFRFHAGEIVERRRYWQLPLVIDRFAKQDEAVERVRSLLDDAVNIRLRSDVPSGVFLSSGVDSTAIVATATRHATQPLRSFTVVLDEKGLDEGPRAAAIARSFGCEHAESRIAPKDILLQVERAVASLDQPSADGVNTFVVSEAARASGLRVALSGIGADEIFAGYQNFRRFAMIRKLSKSAARSRPLSSLVAGASSLRWLPTSGRKLASLLGAAGDPSTTYSMLRGMFLPLQIGALMRAQGGLAEPAPSVRLSEAVSAALTFGQIDDGAAYGALDVSNYLLNTILRDSDAMSMANSLEIREPFLDHLLVEYVMSLPAESKMRGEGNKPLLTAAVASIPRSTRIGKKKGFVLPFDAWLRGPLAEFARARLHARGIEQVGALSSNGVANIASSFYRGSGSISWSRVWSLVVLSDWCTRHRVTV